jgi:hypothetical protein
MTKFVFAYRGGSAPATKEEQDAVMSAWMGWFGQLGAAIVDGGAPFGPSNTIAAGGGVAGGGASALTGYSVVEAADLAAATEMGKGCPVLASGGTVEVYESMPM